MVCVAVRYRVPTLLLLGETLSSSLTFSTWRRSRKNNIKRSHLQHIISSSYSSSDTGVLLVLTALIPKHTLPSNVADISRMTLAAYVADAAHAL